MVHFHNKQNRDTFESVRKIARRSVGLILPTYDKMFLERAISKVHFILSDPTQRLSDCFVFNRSGFRLCVPRTNLTRCRQSFVPNSIHLLNTLAVRK